ncbi:UvrD-helicase domain-containing protein [Egbenema bharatensis]|uniref:UvrD-helicase domain-containing protein n=1 Tax=Egbenema bharatensis TaxID=3463334 RepID=UPI003A8462D1
MTTHLDPLSTQRESILQRLYDRLRPGQQRMADWQGGSLAVSAVPGSGKSTGMAIAAAILLAKRYLRQEGSGEWGMGNREVEIENQASTTENISTPDSRSRSVSVGELPTPDSRLLTPHSSLPTPPGQLILVTFTRSAVANLKTKVRQYLQELSIASQGFMVYTLHGLALNIATRHPELSKLDLSRLTLVSPNQSNRLVRSAVEQWISANPFAYQQLLQGRQFDGEETERLRRQSVLRTEVLPDLAYTAIHEAKSSGLMPADLYDLSQNVTRSVAEVEDYDVLTIAAGLYERYQLLLQNRGFIDYDDMILAALRVLENPGVRQIWQFQTFAVFEDEAQDSSPLQTRLLEILAAHPTDPAHPLNLIRVGDPNQAINSTFTPADPVFFREFCEQCALTGNLAEMDQAGRSSLIITNAANFMLDWVNQRYGGVGSRESGVGSQESGADHASGQAQQPHSSLQELRPRSANSPHSKGYAHAPRTLLSPQSSVLSPQSSVLSPQSSLPFRPQHIHPVPPTDPQPDANPEPEGYGLEIRFPPDVYQTVNLVGQRVADLLIRHPDRRAAVLVRENRQGRFLAELLQNPEQYHLEVNLKELGISIYDVGERDRHSHIPAEILALLQFLNRPHSPEYLKSALQVMVDRQLIPTQDLNAIVSLPEQFLYPSPLDPPQSEPVSRARRYCTSLLRADRNCLSFS